MFLLLCASATEFNKIYVTVYKLAIFISEKLTPCFFASTRYHDEIGNEVFIILWIVFIIKKEDFLMVSADLQQNVLLERD